MNPTAALETARAITHPWFRCQALAWIARYSPENRSMHIAEEALASAATSDDPYEVVAAAAWPLRAMIERGHMHNIDRSVASLLNVAATIAHPVRRLDALYLVWQAVCPLGPSRRRDLQHLLVDTCMQANSWRAGRTLRDLALTVAADDSSGAQKIIANMPESAFRRQATRGLANGQHQSPRPFFWVTASRTT